MRLVRFETGENEISGFISIAKMGDKAFAITPDSLLIDLLDQHLIFYNEQL